VRTVQMVMAEIHIKRGRGQARSRAIEAKEARVRGPRAASTRSAMRSRSIPASRHRDRACPDLHPKPLRRSVKNGQRERIGAPMRSAGHRIAWRYRMIHALRECPSAWLLPQRMAASVAGADRAVRLSALRKSSKSGFQKAAAERPLHKRRHSLPWRPRPPSCSLCRSSAARPSFRRGFEGIAILLHEALAELDLFRNGRIGGVRR